MINLFTRLRRKDGAVVISLVVILMLIFPMIISGLIDMTNCTVIKRNLKQNLNMAAKSAANTMDIYSTRDGVYRIKDGILSDDIYDFSLYVPTYHINEDLSYFKNENDAAKVFYSLLAYNNLIDYTLENTNPTEVFSYITSNNNALMMNGNTKEQYVRVKYSQTADYATKKRASEYSFIVVNNDYDYVRALIDDTLPNRTNPIKLTNENINITQVYAADESETMPTLTIDTKNPTVVGVGVIKYELSPIFHIFGVKNIYLKEYATAELVITDNYWN